MTRQRTNPELWATARLIENLATRIDQVHDHVRHELNNIDSYPDHTPGATQPNTRTPNLTGTCTTPVPIDETLNVWRTCGRYRPCGEHDTPTNLTAVERAAERRLHLNRSLADFDARCKLIVVSASDAMNEADNILGTRLEHTHNDNPNPECRDGQFGKDGNIDWGDPTCEASAVKSGLCTACYWRWYRWRKTNGKRTPETVEPGYDNDGAA